VALAREYGTSCERSETWMDSHSESKCGLFSLVCPAEILGQRFRLGGCGYVKACINIGSASGKRWPDSSVSVHEIYASASQPASEILQARLGFVLVHEAERAKDMHKLEMTSDAIIGLVRVQGVE
jgi:hypothetical protein